MSDEDYVIDDVYVVQPVVVEGVVEEDDNADQTQCKLIRAIATITISTIVLVLIYKMI